MRADRGVVLLEVLVAIALLCVCGLALIGLVSTSLRVEWDARERERVLAAEDRLLAALTLLKSPELDRRLGRHRLGEFIVDVERPEQAVYRIALLQARSPHVEDLVTVVYDRRLSITQRITNAW